MDHSAAGYRGTLRSLGGSAAVLRAQHSVHMSPAAEAIALNSDDSTESDDDALDALLPAVQGSEVHANISPQRSLSDVAAAASRNPSSEVIGSQRSGQVFLRPALSTWPNFLPTSNSMSILPTPRQSPPQAKPVPNILVIGNPQCGKSTLINVYRSSVCLGVDWPSAPTGMCGLHGTTRVDGYPNSIHRPQWILVDTPGYAYDTSRPNSDDEDMLLSMIRGVPWKTPLMKSNHTMLDNIECVPQHKCHHCIIVVNARDFIADRGHWAVLRLQPRYACGEHAGMSFLRLQHLVASVRLHLGDVPPYVVVTHMDQFGGAECAGSRSVLLQVLSKCISPQRTFFVGCPQPPAQLLHTEHRSQLLNVQGVRELRRMHQDLLKSLHWSEEQDDGVA